LRIRDLYFALPLQRRCNYQTSEAATGREAIEKAVAEKPDIIPDLLGISAAVANAICDAVRVRIKKLPLNHETVLAAIEAANVSEVK
jgi:hypothetical protein